MYTNQPDFRSRNARRRRRRRLRIRVCGSLISIALVCILIAFMYLITSEKQSPGMEGSFSNQDVQNAGLTPADADIKITEKGIDLSSLYSPNAILVKLQSGEVISAHGENDKIYPASLTKIITAILAIENTPDLARSTVLPYEIFSGLYAEDASMAGFLPDETATYRDLLYGILLPSGAECCLTFAQDIAGSESAFTDMMNSKAAELGMDHTHFTNTTGLHDTDHYTTVRDLSVLLEYALKNNDFRTAFTSQAHHTQPSELHPDGFTFSSTLFTNLDSSEASRGRILGGKTGYTDEAGLCLASLANINGREYILITAGADGSHTTAQFNILDAIHVYDQLENIR